MLDGNRDVSLGRVSVGQLLVCLGLHVLAGISSLLANLEELLQVVGCLL
jgi:hypothetical protein